MLIIVFWHLKAHVLNLPKIMVTSLYTAMTSMVQFPINFGPLKYQFSFILESEGHYFLYAQLHVKEEFED